jgi:hypothetical protein
MQEPYSYCGGFFKLVPRWDKCINVAGNYSGGRELQWNKLGTFNTVKATHLIFTTWGILLSEHPL